MASSQHRCVFVGNIPYDATEEQLIQICEEAGPVVSFRLVIDRETGKPKGYGFCEYKDEETALSARRNLQGYEINGRQLRVDFAENDKNADRNRELGRGGPGLAANVDPQKQFGGPAVHGDSSLLQPVGLPVAMVAATVMVGALGGAQTGSSSNQNGLQIQQVLGTDPLTLHLAKMPRNQLNEILTEMKVMSTENKEQARQLLLANPQLSKAIFQAHIMLGTVTPQMLQMANIRQAPGPLAQPPLQDGQQVQQPAVQTLPGLPPLAQNKMHLGFMPQQQSQASAGHPNHLIHSQYAALPQLPMQPRFQSPQLAQHQVLQQTTLPGMLGVPTLSYLHPQQANQSIRPEIQVATSSSMKNQVQPSLLQHPGQIASANVGHNTQLVAPNATVKHSLLTHPPSENGFQPSSSILSAIPNSASKNSDKPPQYSNDPTWVRKVDTYPSLPSGLYDKASLVNGSPDQISRPQKLLKLEDGRGASFSAADVVNETASVLGSSQAFSMSRNQISKAEGASDSQKQNSELPPDVESALLQQVLNLTPEQLNSLPRDQQQQVIQLQQMLRQPT